MGQYFLIVNLDKREYLHPHKLGSGLKFYEILSTNIPKVLAALLCQSSDSSDISYGDFDFIGRWARDRIVIIGDYDDSRLYQKAKKEFADISVAVRGQYTKMVEKDQSGGSFALRE